MSVSLPVPTPTEYESPLTVVAFGKVFCNQGKGGDLFCQLMQVRTPSLEEASLGTALLSFTLHAPSCRFQSARENS